MILVKVTNNTTDVVRTLSKSGDTSELASRFSSGGVVLELLASHQ